MQILDKFHSMLRGSTGSARQSERTSMVVEKLEPRILHSADLAPVLAGSASVATPVEQRVIEPEAVPAPAPAVQTEQTHTQELVFVDPRTPDYQQLVNDIRAEAADGRDIKVILLDSQSDGVAQITAYLSGCKDISAIHIISHGSDSTVQIGSALLDTQTLGGYASELHSWSAALAPGADLLIYGCDVAETAGGRAFVDALSHATGTNVAASENLTGNARLGGDWNLEYSTGPIEASVAIDAQTQAQYAGVLAINVGNTSSSMTTGASSLTFAQTIASGANGFLVVNVSFQAGSSNAVTSVTYGGTALTLLGSAQNTTGAHTSTEMWVLKSPAAGTANVVISMNNSIAFTGGATNFFGVDQTTPTGTFVGATANNRTPSVTLGSASGELVIDSLAERATSSGTAGAGQTERYHQNTGTAGGDTWGSSSTETGAASVVMNWSTVGSGTGEWAMGAISLKPAINNAPSLTGANNLTTINEDPGSNPGTLVSALISGMASDADPGALSGIAVTAVDNTNGTWQYSTDGGGGWVAFGTPNATSARLLAADAASTYVRFVPNANWNGTVTNGLTFRAWDQTSGVNGGTADTTSATNTVLDTFNSVSYSNNDGTASWTAGWVDSQDGNPSAGNITVSGGQLVLSAPLGANDSISREANLSGATGATLSFSYNNSLALLGGTVSLQASNGGSYTTLATFSAGSNTGSGTFSTDISTYVSGTTRIQFVVNGGLLGGSLSVDNVQIAYVTPLNGGSSAFSTATASSSITVNAVNDAPTLSAPASTAVTEDVASAITGISFSDVDAGSASVLASFSVPQGTLAAVSGGGVTVGGSASALTLTGSIANINAFIAGSNLSYTTAPNDTSAVTLGVSINDQGNTGSGGALSAAGSVTLNVTAVNDAPAGANNTVSTPEDTGYVFASTDFGFTDPNDTPSNALLAVKITTVPGAGTLTLSGTAVSAGQFVSVTDINAGNLVFTPALNANGSGYASFTFQVQDNGGTANGGVDLDPVARTMSIDVNAVNDAPIAVVPGPQSTATNATLVFSTAGGNAISIGDPDAGASPVQVSLSVANGTLTLAGAAGLVFTTGTGSGDGTMKFTGTIAAINTALDGLAFTPTVGYSGGTVLSVTVDDLGNTGSGGALTAGGNVMIAVALPPPAIITLPPVGGPAIVIGPAGPPAVTTPALPDQGGPSAISPEAPAVTPAPQAPGATESAPAQAEEAASTVAGDSTSVSRASQNMMTAPDSGQATHSGRGSNVAFGGRDVRLLLATSEQPEVALNDFALTSKDTPYATQIALAALRSTDLLNELDRLREGLQEESTSEAHAVALTTAATLGLSVGYVFWLLRGGVLLSTLLSSMPAWRLVDPLPILGRLEDDDDAAGDVDESLESLVARQNRAGGGEQSEPEPA